MKLKVCGMRDPENIRAVTALSPDFMGFIFYPESSRYVGGDFQMPSDFPAAIRKVAVFVDASLAEIEKRTAENRFDYVQLHGNESVAFCQAVNELGLAVIKVFSVGTDFNFDSTRDFETVAAYFLFDTKGGLRGGNGIPFDWSVLTNYTGSVPYFLSGGLAPENISDALALGLEKLYALDLNSRVEVLPGMKNAAAIAEVKKQITPAHEK